MSVHGTIVENMIPVLVINCAADTDRRDALVRGADVRFINAVDARLGVHVFKPYLHLLRDQFWLDDQIKPGAFACFISHRLAWQTMVDTGLPVALITEDDSRVSQMNMDVIVGNDLTFVNDRACDWVPSGDLNAIFDATPAVRGFGADGYVLTQQGAQALLAQSERDGVVCGVDWYLAYAAMDTRGLKHADVKSVSEVKKLWKTLGPRAPLLQASVSQTPWVINARNGASTIGHSNHVNIHSFRQDIEKA
jgi:GR25 family glycosyltransferase involved in LPS biosynthesis